MVAQARRPFDVRELLDIVNHLTDRVLLPLTKRCIDQNVENYFDFTSLVKHLHEILDDVSIQQQARREDGSWVTESMLQEILVGVANGELEQLTRLLLDVVVAGDSDGYLILPVHEQAAQHVLTRLEEPLCDEANLLRSFIVTDLKNPLEQHVVREGTILVIFWAVHVPRFIIFRVSIGLLFLWRHVLIVLIVGPHAVQEVLDLARLDSSKDHALVHLDLVVSHEAHRDHLLELVESDT